MFKLKFFLGVLVLSKKEIVKLFLDNRLQLNDETLDFFFKNQTKIEPFLEMMKKQEKKPLIITIDFLMKILHKEELGFEILKEFSQPQGKYSTIDLVQFLQDRYNFLRDILKKRIDLINLLSINKISKRTKKFSIIAMVREKDEDTLSIEVEDLTNSLSLGLDKKNFNYLVPDEVAGFICEKKDDKIFGRKVIFPDIPLKKEANKTNEDIYCLFFSDFHLCSLKKKDLYKKFLNYLNNLNYQNVFIFFLGDISSRKEDLEKLFNNLPNNSNIIFLKGELERKIKLDKKFVFENPIMLKIGGVKIFLSHGDIFSHYTKYFGTPSNTILQLLKKRNFNPTISYPTNLTNTYLIDTIPDIIAVGHFHSPSTLNYKGTTSIITGSFLTKPIYWGINLRTREINKIDMAQK
jgi:DNA polymerase II small subunit/DNA polymerase delta subunit B